MKIVFVSDIHVAPGKNWSRCIWKYTPQDELPGLIRSFVEIVNSEIKPDVVFELGDRIIDVDEGTDEFNTKTVYNEIDLKVHCPVLHVHGNHDFVNVPKSRLNQVLHSPELPHMEKISGYKIIAFDSLDPMIDGVGGEVSQRQLKWLSDRMNEDYMPKIVLSHHPLNNHQIHRNFLIPKKTVPLMMVKNSEEIRNILENGRNFLFHAAGHLHWWSFRISAKGAYLVNPPLSAAHPAIDNAPGLFMEAEVSPDGLVDAKIHSINPRRVLGDFTNR